MLQTSGRQGPWPGVANGMADCKGKKRAGESPHVAILLAEVDRQVVRCDLSEHCLLCLPPQQRRCPDASTSIRKFVCLRYVISCLFMRLVECEKVATGSDDKCAGSAHVPSFGALYWPAGSTL